MGQFPQQNFNAMRQDAIRRSREMQRRAGIPQPAEQKKPEIPDNPPQPQLPSELEGLLHGWDAERLALLGLLYILYKDGADLGLILAIAYILL
ncbi:MAG: hypothetical protein E7502_04115 [Ruminococcus sp.]|jgi:hypothetical protein|nr:hypothetical protein [Ruminococcus sp.]